MQSLAIKFILIFIVLPVVSFAAVWESPNYWDQTWETKFSEWMKTQVERDIFKNKFSKWNGTRTDCADAAYAMRIIFSSENGLPFKMKNPSGSRPEEGAQAKFLTNETTAFDTREAGVKRVIRFIEYIGDSVGTEHLAYHDSYSTTVQSINPGHIYIYQYNGGRTRHTYVVKDRLIDGNLILFYSTVPKAVRKLARKKGMPEAFSGSPWGFKKFKQPSYYDEGFVYTEETHKSNEQYKLLEKVGRSNLMSFFKKMLQLEEENLVAGLNRYLENACYALHDRQEVINLTQDYLSRKGGRCMNKSEYYNFSTPGRDKHINDTLEALKETWDNIVISDRYLNVPTNLTKGLNFLTDKKINSRGEIVELGRKDTDGLKELNKLCQVNFENKGKTYSLNLKDFSSRYNAKSFWGARKLSPHPNDSVLLRWGYKTKKSKCKKY